MTYRGFEASFIPEDIFAIARKRLRELGGLALIMVTAIIAAALATWSVNDPSFSHATSAPVRNLLGTGGAVTADLLMQLIGLASIALIAPIAAWGWRLEGRFVHRLRLSWWDVDELEHALNLCVSGEELWACCQDFERQFQAEATRRVLIQRLELEAWLAVTSGSPVLIAEEPVRKRLALEATAMRIHRRFGQQALRHGA